MHLVLFWPDLIINYFLVMLMKLCSLEKAIPFNFPCENDVKIILTLSYSYCMV